MPYQDQNVNALHRTTLAAQTPLDDVLERHEFLEANISDAAEVAAAAEGRDAIVNCAVIRDHRELAFRVNTQGTFNAVSAAVAAGHERFVNTGTEALVAGWPMQESRHGMSEDMPMAPGVDLYPITKALGQEICAVHAANSAIHVLTCLFASFVEPEPLPGKEHQGMSAFSHTFADAARAVRCCLEVELPSLPSRCEMFFIGVPAPHGKFQLGKAARLLGWEPRSTLERYYRQRL